MPDLPLVATRLIGQPLAVRLDHVHSWLPNVLPKILGGLPLQAQSGEQSMRPPVTQAQDQSVVIHVIPVFGTLVARGAGMIAWSGQTSYEALEDEIGAALADPRVGGILLDVNSPGGEYLGLPELVRFLAKDRNKPIWAIARHHMASAAVWLASQCDRIVASPSACLGSIGIRAVHVDVTEADKREGYKYTFFHAGAEKLDGDPHLPLPKRVAEKWQKLVDDAYDEFCADVGRGRMAAGAKFNAAAARATEARYMRAEEALELGLADAVMTMDAALAALARHILDRNSANGGKMGPKNSGATGAAPGTTAETTAADPAAAATTTVTPATAGAGNVVDINAARDQGHAAALEYAQAVTDTCKLAGFADRAAGFIAAMTPIAEVRSVLMKAQADATDATATAGHLPPKPGASGGAATKARIDHRAIYARMNGMKEV